MSNRNELLSNALTERLRELRATVAQLVPADFGQMSDLVSSVQQLIAGNAAGVTPHGWQEPTFWLESTSDCMSSVRKLALGETVQGQRGARPQTESFLRELRSRSNESDQRFQLLSQRYSCPLNFALGEEDQVREFVLERSMVQDRRRAEKNSMGTDDLLLQLNLIAVYACLTSDLRFLDALNYYFELIPSNWRPHAQHDWLMVSCFALYARALTARL